MESTNNEGAITREEWMRRYADHFRARTCCEADFAEEAAKTGAESYEQQERDFGREVIWWGGPSGANNTPEDEADEELSYWTDDEGGAS